jgi:glycosyltransferase involved in cell wall biosynthesis
MSNSAARDADPCVMLVCDYSLSYLGGAQIAFVRQAEALAAAGWKVVVVAPDADQPALVEAPGIICIPTRPKITVPGLGLPVIGTPTALVALLGDLVLRHSVTEIIVHSEFTLAGAAIEVGRRDGVPVLHTVHTFFWHAPTLLAPLAPVVTMAHTRGTRLPREPAYEGGSAIDNALRSMTLRVALRADVVLSPSRHQAAALTAAGVPGVRILSNVAEPPRRSSHAVDAAGGSHGAAAGERSLSLVWAGRFASEKRLDAALNAVRAVRARRGAGRVHLDVAGGRRRDLPDVTFHGRVSTDHVGTLIEEADAVLISSVGFDNQPMIALEAFARGKPVIVCDDDLGTEFGDAAITAAGRDAEAIADTIERLIDDPDELAFAAAAGYAFAASRQPRAHADALRREFVVARERLLERVVPTAGS